MAGKRKLQFGLIAAILIVVTIAALPGGGASAGPPARLYFESSGKVTMLDLASRETRTVRLPISGGCPGTGFLTRSRGRLLFRGDGGHVLSIGLDLRLPTHPSSYRRWDSSNARPLGHPFFNSSSGRRNRLVRCHGSSGTRMLRVRDPVSGRAKTFSPPPGFGRFACSEARFSPAQRLIAVPVTRGTRPITFLKSPVHLALIDIGAGSMRLISGSRLPAIDYLMTAWASDGHSVFMSSRNRELIAYDLETQQIQRMPLRVGAFFTMAAS
jgi:hypothetical protein